MLETYFEILISSVLIIGMFKTRAIRNEMDIISVVIQSVFLILCILFAFFLIWFNLVYVKELSDYKNRAQFLWWDNYSISYTKEINNRSWHEHWKDLAMADDY